MFADGETEAKTTAKTSSTTCLESLCDTQLMEQRCSCFQLPFGDHKGITLCEVTEVNSQAVLYTLTQGAGPRDHIFWKKLPKNLSICWWFSHSIKTEVARSLRWGAFCCRGTILIKKKCRIYSALPKALWGQVCVTLLILGSVNAVAKDALAGTGCALWALLPLDICGDLQLCQLAAALEGWESHTLKMNF